MSTETVEMPELPKLVRDRLRRQSRPLVDHPDADVLTAYSELSLPELERAVVLEHLARCSDCREIVALALPEMTESPTQAPSRQTLYWPAFRWAFASAGLLAIALLGFLQYQRHTAHMATMFNKAPSVMHAKTETLPSVTAGINPDLDKSDTISNSAEKSKKQVSPALIAPRPAPIAPNPAPVAGVLGGKAMAHGPMQSNQWQQQNLYTTQAAPLSPPAPEAKQVGQPSAGARVASNSEMVEVASQPATDTQSQELSGYVVSKNEITQLPSQTRQTAEMEVERAKPAASTPSAVLAQANQPALRSLKSPSPIAPRWTINSAGGLQRSFDQGSTWHDVDVNNSPAAATEAVEVSASTARAKDATSFKTAKKQPAQPVFRTVAVSGSDVWAGGASGLLYHSSDAGEHWTRVTPSSSGAVLTGDILTMEFPTSENGKIVTSTGEAWVTADSGQTWQRQ